MKVTSVHTVTIEDLPADEAMTLQMLITIVHDYRYGHGSVDVARNLQVLDAGHLANLIAYHVGGSDTIDVRRDIDKALARSS